MARIALRDKKEALKREQEREGQAKPAFFSGKMGKAYAKLFQALKFVIGICLLPLVYSSVAALTGQLDYINHEVRRSLWGGAVAFLITFLFIWEGEYIYTKGHRLMEIAFGFFQPLVKVAPFLVPIYAILVTLIFGVVSIFIKEPWLHKAFIFLFGFTIALHLVFSSRSIRGKGKNFLNPDYIFIFSCVYILNIWFTAAMLNLLSPEFSLIDFANSAIAQAGRIFNAIFNQLFVVG